MMANLFIVSDMYNNKIKIYQNDLQKIHEKINEVMYKIQNSNNDLPHEEYSKLINIFDILNSERKRIIGELNNVRNNFQF